MKRHSLHFFFSYITLYFTSNRFHDRFHPTSRSVKFFELNPNMAFDVRNNFHIVDYAVFALFLLCSALIGVIFGWRSRKSTDNKEFLTGNRNLPMFPVVMSLAASFMSTNTMLGVPAEIYLLGTQFIINLVPIIFSIILSANVFMPVFYRLNMTSVNEYLKLRFKSQAARLVGSWAFLLCTVGNYFQCFDVIKFGYKGTLHGRRLVWAVTCTQFSDPLILGEVYSSRWNHLYFLYEFCKLE